MKVRLSQIEFQQLLRIVQTQPEFGLARDRRRLVAAALTDVDRTDIMLGRIDFDITSFGVATEVIRFLVDFGQVTPGREALGVFINQLLVNIGASEDADVLANLIEARSLITPQSPPSLTDLPKPTKNFNGSNEYIFIPCRVKYLAACRVL